MEHTINEMIAKHETAWSLSDALDDEMEISDSFGIDRIVALLNKYEAMREFYKLHGRGRVAVRYMNKCEGMIDAARLLGYRVDCELQEQAGYPSVRRYFACRTDED